MNWKKIAAILSGLVFIAGLLACGYLGLKMIIQRRSGLYREATSAYEQKDYAAAEPLLLQYVETHPEAEAEFVALANIYREFGNAGMEAQMWQKAYNLNPLNREYYDNVLTSSVKSASYSLLHGILGRIAKSNEDFTDRELYLFVISSFRSNYPKDGINIYKKRTDADPEAFHRSELGRIAEFLVTYDDLSEGDRDMFLTGMMRSEDPVCRFEAFYTTLRRMEKRDGDDPGNSEEYETLLKRIVETNYFAGTPLLADYYFWTCRFSDVMDVVKPYLKSIDDIAMYLLYAETCVFEGKKDELVALEKKLRAKPGFLPGMADYCEILIAHLENDVPRLASAVRRYGKIVDTPLSRFIRLRVAIANDSFEEIRTVAKEIFSHPPYHDLHDRALVVCMDYVSREMKKPENRLAPSGMADLAGILSGYLHGNRLLTEIVFLDRFKKNLLTTEAVTTTLEDYPDDALIRRAAAEYYVRNGESERALDVIEQILESGEEEQEGRVRDVLILKMLALDRLGQIDEAAAIFRDLLERSGFEPELLTRYFQYCLNRERTGDLASMADALDAAKDGAPADSGKVFRAAALLAGGDEARKDEALDLLASASPALPEFTFYAANRLYGHGRLDDAETKYTSILETFRYPSLPYLNLSGIYRARDEEKKAMDAAKKAVSLETESRLPGFVYAEMLAGAGQFENALTVLDFPHHTVGYPDDIVDLWRDCMCRAIEKSLSDRKYMQAEEQCRHLQLVIPGDEFARDTIKMILETVFPKKDNAQQNGDEFAPAAPAF